MKELPINEEEVSETLKIKPVTITVTVDDFPSLIRVTKALRDETFQEIAPRFGHSVNEIHWLTVRNWIIQHKRARVKDFQQHVDTAIDLLQEAPGVQSVDFNW